MTERCDCTTCPLLRDPAALLECLAKALVPNDCRSLEDWQRLHHKDLQELSDARLAQEALQIRAVLPFLRSRHPDAAWLAERLGRLEAEARRRAHEQR
jgi:hypothetical protein